MIPSIKCKTRFYRLFPSTGYLGYGFEDYEAEYARSAFIVIDVYGLASILMILSRRTIRTAMPTPSVPRWPG